MNGPLNKEQVEQARKIWGDGAEFHKAAESFPPETGGKSFGEFCEKIQERIDEAEQIKQENTIYEDGFQAGRKYEASLFDSEKKQLERRLENKILEEQVRAVKAEEKAKTRGEMRAKFKINQIIRLENGAETLKFAAVSGSSPEDNTYSKYTPIATLEMTVTNPDLVGKFNPGETYYLDFTKCRKEPWEQ